MREDDTELKGLTEKVEQAWKKLKGDGDELKKAQEAFVADVEKAIKLDETKEEGKKDETAPEEPKPAETAEEAKTRKMRLMRARKLAMASKIKKTKPVIRKSYKH